MTYGAVAETWQNCYKIFGAVESNRKQLERNPPFSGKDEDFPEWVFAFRGLLGLLKLAESAKAAEGMQESDLTLDDMDLDMVGRAHGLWYLLVNSCKGKASTLLQGCEELNGFLAWHRLCHSYRPALGGRFNSMLMALLSPPGWRECASNFELSQVSPN